MRIGTRRCNIGVRSVAIAIAWVLIACGAWPAWGEEVIGKGDSVIILKDADRGAEPRVYREVPSTESGAILQDAEQQGRARVYREEKVRTGNRVFFRGGWAGATSDRSGELFTDVHGAAVPLGVGGNAGGDSGYYVGAGLDLMLSRDSWGMMKGIAVVGELGVEYKRYNSPQTANTGNLGLVPSPPPGGINLGVTSTAPSTAQITTLTVSVSPKVKFRQDTDFQPWIIPVGLDFHVISPPSNQTNYLDIGVQFGAGAEFRVWKELWLGVDGRFHLASNQTNTVNNYGTAGAYVAIGF